MSTTRPAEDVFIAARQREWTELDTLLSTGVRLHKLPPERIARVGALYRMLCSDVARARAAGYSRESVAHLDALAARAHAVIYRAQPYRRGAVRELLVRDFPRSVRSSGRFVLAAAALFGLPLLLGLFGALASTELATAVVPASTLEQMAEVYSDGVAGGRGEDQDTAMAGFYVYNNVGIAFRCFATGIFFGLGSAFFLVYNGVVTGAVLGYVIDAGAGRGIVTFICGHGAFELTAIVIAGAGGLRMGYALVRTGGRTRLGSLRSHAPEVARLVLGAALMLGIAALIEGFWSPSSVPDPIKWSVAVVLWCLVIAWLALAGRIPSRRSAP
jgi:uncharacterized membrane protein SpoIIM required for sporulation